MEPRMESPAAADASSILVPSPAPGLVSRAVAIFTQPARAWSGLPERVQWWFPVLCVALVGAAVAWLLHDRAVVPMLQDTWRDQVANGQMQAEQMRRMEEFFAGPRGVLLSVGQQFIFLPIMVLLTALVVWFGAGF